MASRKHEIALGQFVRSLTHIRRFNRAVKNPREAQTEKLMRIIRANEDTAFGRKHNFAGIASVRDFQKNVPASDYEYFRPYVNALMMGERKQLTAEEPFMFATTSGTTEKPKFVPITESHLRDYTHAFQVHNYHMIRDFPEAAVGQYMIISSNDEEGMAPSGIPYGAVSGLLNRRQPAIIRRFFALPYEICKIKDVDAKYYLMLRLSLAQNVTAILCCNPSSLLLLSDQLCERAKELIADLRDGTLNPKYSPPDDVLEAVRPWLTAAPHRARQLEMILNQQGSLFPRMVWPNLMTMSCWKGGPMSFYLDRLESCYGDVPIRDFGYMASEGRGSIPLKDDGAGGVVAVSSHFFEFSPEEDVDESSRRYLMAHELELGGRYFIYFTTAAGLYRYNINDIVKVVGFHEKTPIIEFVRKGAGVSSVTGEKLTEEHVRQALEFATRQLNLTCIKHFTAAVELTDPPRYNCFAEVEGAIAEPLRVAFVRIFDQSLQTQNPEYHDKRATRRLGAPNLVLLPPGTYTRLRQQRVAEGAPEAQVKVPLLSPRTDFKESLAALPGPAAPISF